MKKVFITSGPDLFKGELGTQKIDKTKVLKDKW